MSLTPEQRAAFLALLPALAPEGDASPAVGFFRANREACLAEFGALPGFDQVRAGLLRLLPALGLDEGAFARACDDAEAAIDRFDPDLLARPTGLARHPAWVGLCVLEIAELRRTDAEAARQRAVRLAGEGFARTAPHDPRGPGEILWALAEAAGEVGWSDHVDVLLEQAALADFADPENRGRVRLLQILRLLAVDERRAPPAVDALLAFDALDPQTRTHTLWIGAHLDREHGRLERAVRRLEEAAGIAEAEEETDVLERIRSTLAAWGVHGHAPAEA